MPGINDYSMLAVWIYGGPIVLCTNFLGQSLVGGTVYETTSNEHVTLAVRCPMAGDTLTYGDVSTLYHYANSSHGSQLKKRITRIAGLF